MLSPSDKLRAGFAPNDIVRFEYRRKMVAGTIVRTNPKRAVVLMDHEEYTVPYELLEPLADPSMHEVRLAGIMEQAAGLMEKHGLHKWTFRFDDSTRRAGCCNYCDRTISIAFELARNGTDDDIRDTILHEIAHALAGRKHNHDAVWKAKAKEIGCSGERTHRLQFTTPRYAVACENKCWSGHAERRTKRLVCRTCGGRLVYSTFREQT